MLKANSWIFITALQQLYEFIKCWQVSCTLSIFCPRGIFPSSMELLKKLQQPKFQLFSATASPRVWHVSPEHVLMLVERVTCAKTCCSTAFQRIAAQLLFVTWCILKPASTWIKALFIVQKHTNRFLLFGDNDFHLNTNFDMEKTPLILNISLDLF